MGINYKSHNAYFRSKTPLKFVLIAFAALAVNLLILSGLQILLAFRLTVPVGSEMLSRLDSRFENCTVLDTAVDSSQFPTEHCVILLETAEGETFAVTLEKHFLVNRYRYREEMLLSVPDTPGEQLVSSAALRYDISLWVEDHSRITNYQAFSKFPALTGTFLILSAMCAVELAVYGFVFKKEELA